MSEKSETGLEAKHAYPSDVLLGHRYRDTQTGLEGVASSVHFFQYACERVTLEVMMRDGKLEELTFDAPRLVHAQTGGQAQSDRPGGPGAGVRQGFSRPSIPSR